MLPKDLIKKIRRIEIKTSRVVNDALAGQYHSAFKGRGMEFEEVRRYQVGDDVRSIDWNVSARYGEPFVKVFREERELTVVLLVDMSPSEDFGTDAQLKRELIAELGATLAFSAIKNNDKVGLVAFTDRIEKLVPPRKGTSHVLRVIRELLALEPEGRGTDIAAAVEHLGRILHRRAVVFVISDFQDESDFTTALAMARRRHDIIPIRVVDRAERAWPAAGLVELEDAETGERVVVDSSSRRWRDAYARLAAEADDALQRSLRRIKVGCVEVQTGRSFIEPLARFFREREGRRSR